MFQKIANQGLGFIRSALSGSDGGVSSTRVLIVVTFAFVLGVGGGLAHGIKYPITLPDFNAFLVSAGNFLATACSPLYLINKGAEAYSGSKHDDDKRDGDTTVNVVVPPSK